MLAAATEPMQLLHRLHSLRRVPPVCDATAMQQKLQCHLRLYHQSRCELAASNEVTFEDGDHLRRRLPTSSAPRLCSRRVCNQPALAGLGEDTRQAREARAEHSRRGAARGLQAPGARRADSVTRASHPCLPVERARVRGRRACNHPALAGLGDGAWQAGEAGAEGGGGDVARALQAEGTCGECSGERRRCAVLVCGHLICEACAIAQARAAHVACTQGISGFAVLRSSTCVA